MRKVILGIGLIILLAIPAFAGGGFEDVLTMMVWGDLLIPPENKGKLFATVAKEFMTETGIPVSLSEIANEDDSAKKIWALWNSGNPPNVYQDYIGRVGLFADAQYAVDLTKYISQDVLDKFIPSMLDQYTKDGALYALPMTSWTGAGYMNLDLVGQSGLPDPRDNDGITTYDEIAEITRALQAKGIEAFAVPVHAGDDGGDYWVQQYWLPGHGAKLFEDGLVALNTPEGAAALTRMKAWYDEGLIEKGSAAFRDGDYLGSWNSGRSVTAAATLGSFPIFKAAVVTTPRVDSSYGPIPVSNGPDAIMVFATGSEEERQAAADLIVMATNEKYQKVRVYHGRLPSLLSIDTELAYENTAIDAVGYTRGLEIAAEEGVMNLGMGTLWYGELRGLWAAMIQAVLTEELSVQEALDRYERQGNEAITRER